MLESQRFDNLEIALFELEKDQFMIRARNTEKDADNKWYDIKYLPGIDAAAAKIEYEKAKTDIVDIEK